MITQFTSIDRIFSAVNKMKPEGFNEIDVIGWVGEALEFIGTNKVYEEAIEYLIVENFQTKIPNWTHNIIQIVRDLDYAKLLEEPTLCDIPLRPIPEETPPTVPEVEDDCCNPNIGNCYYPPEGDGHPVLINQIGEPLTEFDLAFYRPYSDWYLNNHTMRKRFSPVRLATNSFFNSIVCTFEEDSQNPLYQTCTDEYKIIEDSVLRFSFQEGAVVLAFLKTKLDENGYPRIPENVSIIKAITAYIRLQYAQEDYDNFRQGSENRLSKAESDWQWYCKQSSNSLLIPSSVDEWENLKQQRDYLVPRNHYYGYFGHLGKAEKRTYLTNTNKR